MKKKFANNGTLSPERRLIQLRYDAKKKYGLTREQVLALREQPCEICGVKAKKMCIDHKQPGTFRGVLCQQCNVRLGWFETNFSKIMDYVIRGPQNAIDKIKNTKSV